MANFVKLSNGHYLNMDAVSYIHVEPGVLKVYIVGDGDDQHFTIKVLPDIENILAAAGEKPVHATAQVKEASDADR